LFTGNTFYYTYAAFRRKLRWAQVVKLWGSSYLGNVIGAAIFALLIYLTGLFRDPSVHGFLLGVVEKKMHAPWDELFLRAILCNWLVCLAFFIPMSLKGDGAKMFAMMLFVFCFFISGYEHSIANMCTFALALVSTWACLASSTVRASARCCRSTLPRRRRRCSIARPISSKTLFDRSPNNENDIVSYPHDSRLSYNGWSNHSMNEERRFFVTRTNYGGAVRGRHEGEAVGAVPARVQIFAARPCRPKRRRSMH